MLSDAQGGGGGAEGTAQRGRLQPKRGPIRGLQLEALDARQAPGAPVLNPHQRDQRVHAEPKIVRDAIRT